MVGDALRKHGIRAVLTGGACATIYSKGWYLSGDADFVLTGEVRRSRLNEAMASIGFRHEKDRYIHPEVEFFVEFPRGPLAIGRDYEIRPVYRAIRGRRALVLSATDSCRDRLAAFYHWNDRQSLRVAVRIAVENRLSWARIRRWSDREGFAEKYAEFQRAFQNAKRTRNESRPRAQKTHRS